MKKILQILSVVFLISVLMNLTSCKNKVKEEDVSGTIGKVDKYRQEQMNKHDVLLRSELLGDTTRLGKTVNGMLAMYAYTDTLVGTLEQDIKELANSPANESNNLCIEEVGEFCEYIRNENEALAVTIAMYWDIYEGNDTKGAIDVEHNLRNYVNYVVEISNRDSVLDNFIDLSDLWVLENEDEEEYAQDIVDLKSLRDIVLLKNMQMAVVFNDLEKLQGGFFNRTLFNVESLNSIGYPADEVGLKNIISSALMSEKQDGVKQSEEYLQAFMAGHNLSNLIKSHTSLGVISDASVLGATMLSSDKAFLENFSSLSNNEILNNVKSSFIITGKADLSGYLKATHLSDNIKQSSEALKSIY